MKIESIKDRIGEAVNKAEKISGKNPTLPIISGVYLKAERNNLEIKATNLDLGISINIPIKITEPGEVVVPAHILNSFLSSLMKEKSITLETEGQTLLVKTNSTETKIKTLPSEDFPIIPKLTHEEGFSMPARDFVQGLRSVLYAAAVGSMKPELSSIYIAYENKELIFAATDSFRLAEKRVKVKKVPHFTQILVPQKNAQEIARVFDNYDDEIFISIEENQVALRTGDTYVVSRIIDGVFPDYKQIVPKEISSKAIILKQDLLSSLKTALIFSDSFNQLHLKLAPEKKLFEIESRNSNVGENTYAVPAAIEGKDLGININHRYLVDCFQSISADTVSLSFSGEARPILVEGVGDKSFMYLVMPMNRS